MSKDMAASAAAAATTGSGVAAAPWKALLQKSIHQNSNLPYAKYMQLATVRDGKPANRTVVFRGFLQGTDHLTFVTDSRSRKVGELAANPQAEVCWYFPTSREQYRLSGSVDVVTVQHADQQLLQARQDCWAAMSDAGRSQFRWPHPGQPRLPMDEELFLMPAPESAGSVLDNFCLAVMHVHQVDLVDLFANKRTFFTKQEAAAKATAAAGGDGAASDGQQATWLVENLNP